MKYWSESEELHEKRDNPIRSIKNVFIVFRLIRVNNLLTRLPIIAGYLADFKIKPLPY